MALRYTGRADTFYYNGRPYKCGDVIPGMSEREAAHMMNASNLHTFEDAGKDLMEKLTEPKSKGSD